MSWLGWVAVEAILLMGILAFFIGAKRGEPPDDDEQ